MDDLTITKLCAEAMGWKLEEFSRGFRCRDEDNYIVCIIGESSVSANYDPLHDDAQAMALVKRFNVKLTKTPKYETWRTVAYSEDNYFLSATTNQDLNRAICETIAKMQQEKAHSSPA